MINPDTYPISAILEQNAALLGEVWSAPIAPPNVWDASSHELPIVPPLEFGHHTYPTLKLRRFIGDSEFEAESTGNEVVLPQLLIELRDPSAHDFVTELSIGYQPLEVGDDESPVALISSEPAVLVPDDFRVTEWVPAADGRGTDDRAVGDGDLFGSDEQDAWRGARFAEQALQASVRALEGLGSVGIQQLFLSSEEEA
jgi:hypothetical protein